MTWLAYLMCDSKQSIDYQHAQGGHVPDALNCNSSSPCLERPTSGNISASIDLVP